MEQANAPDANLNSVETLDQLFLQRVRQTPAGEAYRQFDTQSGKWVGYTWEGIAASVDIWCRAIDALALSQGDRVAILLPNGVNAICADQATLARGLVPVPMHALDNPESIGYILNDCQASLLVVTTHAQWLAIASTAEAFPHLRLVVIADGGGLGTDPADLHAPPPLRVTLRGMQEWLASASAAAPTRTVLPCPVHPEDLAAIVYTSGTTGKPKGVMLTHRNVLSNVKAVIARVPVMQNDVYLSFLPLSHTFERTVGYY
ncbi:MAG: AMP-binding protein, partial [Burkholderiales bacterium]